MAFRARLDAPSTTRWAVGSVHALETLQDPGGRVSDEASTVVRFALRRGTEHEKKGWWALLGSGRAMAAIPVADLALARSFYGVTLGLEPVFVDLPGSQLYKCGSGSHLVIYQAAAGSRPEQHVATFLVEDIENEVATLRERGVEFEDYDLPELKTVDGIATVGPVKGAWFKDPDGNVIGVVRLSTPI